MKIYQELINQIRKTLPQAIAEEIVSAQPIPGDVFTNLLEAIKAAQQKEKEQNEPDRET